VAVVPDLLRLYPNGNGTLHQDGAPCHTSNVTRAGLTARVCLLFKCDDVLK
jgi:hypothetical protein